MFEPATEEADYEPAPSPHPPNSPSITTATVAPSFPLGLNASIFGYRAISPSLQHFHPSLPQAVALYAAFTNNVAPVIYIFHMPTLTRVYWDAISSLASVDKHTEALLFAVHYSAVLSLTSEECLKALGETRETMLERYRFATEQALARGNLLDTQNMTMLQAAVLFLSALPNQGHSRAVWTLTAAIYHIARTMGLHRDGTTFGLGPFETELRRRLWWQICAIDSRSSEYHCNEPIARGFASDTKPPLHINDADLWPGMVEPVAEQWSRATDMTLSLIRCEAIQAGWKLNLVKQKQPRGAENSDAAAAVEDSRETVKKQLAVIQYLESRLRDMYLPICDHSVPLQLLASGVARIIIARFWLIGQHSVASVEKEAGEKNKSDPFPRTPNDTGQGNNIHDELFKTSIQILEVTREHLTAREFLQWNWYSMTYISWGVIAFLLSELCARPNFPEYDRVWDSVTTIYERWNNGNQDDEGRLALGRPIRRLMAKARFVREMQQTDPRRPAQAGRQAQQHDATATPTHGVPSHYRSSVTDINDWSTFSPQAMSSTPMEEDGGPSDPFMGFLSNWPSIGGDGDTATSLIGLDLGFPPNPI